MFFVLFCLSLLFLFVHDVRNGFILLIEKANLIYYLKSVHPTRESKRKYPGESACQFVVITLRLIIPVCSGRRHTITVRQKEKRKKLNGENIIRD